MRHRLDGIAATNTAVVVDNNVKGQSKLPPQLPKRKKKLTRIQSLKSQQKYSHSSPDLQKELFAVLQKRKKSCD